MKSYTITLRPDTIRGKYYSTVVSGLSVIIVALLFFGLLAVGGFYFFTEVVANYSEVAANYKRFTELQAENRVLQTELDRKTSDLREVQNRIDIYFKLSEKINRLVEIRDVGAGGYSGNSLNDIENIKLGFELLLERFEKQAEYSQIFQYLPIHFPLQTDQFRFTSAYGLRRSPFNAKGVEMHNGIDLAARRGTKIYAAGSGEVLAAGRWKTTKDPSYSRLGKYVLIQHGDTNYATLYGHCNKLLVKKGAIVEAGQPIALVGNTGWSTGPHLHFAITHNGVYVDPEKYLIEFDAEQVMTLMNDQ